MCRPDPIFVSIASYRDPELIPTLLDMIAQAADPAALHVAICWQHDDDISIFVNAGMTLENTSTHGEHDIFTFIYQTVRIQVISIHYYHSRGACWARHLSEQFYQGEEWFLQIDSHCRFATGWDREAVTMARSLLDQTPRPVLSTYPPAYDPADESKRTQFISRLVFREFSAEGIPMLSSVPFKQSHPMRCGYLAGGLIFAPGSFVRDVPNDPSIFFAGEEISMAARAFTHGYDIFTPDRILIWHYYQRKEASKIWGDHTNEAKNTGSVDLAWWERDKISKKRVRSVLGLEASPADPGAYGHGTVRTLAQFEKCIGVDLLSQTVMPDVIGSLRQSYFPEGSVSEVDWLARRVHPNKRKITFTSDELAEAPADVDWWHIGVYCPNNTLLEKQTLTREAMAAHFVAQKNSWDIELSFSTPATVKPAVVRICPYSHQGWGNVVEKTW